MKEIPKKQCKIEKGNSWLLALVLLFGTLAIIPGAEPRIWRPVNFTLLLLISAGFYAASKRNIFLGLLIVWTGIISRQNVFADPQLYFSIFGLIIFYLYVSQDINLNRDLLYDALIGIAACNLAFQIMQAFGIFYLIRLKSANLPGLMSNINETSALYGILAPAFFRRKRIWFFPIIIAGLVLAHSRQGVIALAVVGAGWALMNFNRRYVMSALAGIFILLGLFHFSVKPFSVDTVRLSVWNTTAKLAFIKPVMGWGLGEYKKVMTALTAKNVSPEIREVFRLNVLDQRALKQAEQVINESDKQEEAFFEAHNEYVEWLFTAGFTGLFLLLIFLFDALCTGYQQKDRIPFYGLLASSVVVCFSFSWHIFPLALITALYAGLIGKGEPA